jgi:cysteinyl-tRNA synthetase
MKVGRGVLLLLVAVLVVAASANYFLFDGSSGDGEMSWDSVDDFVYILQDIDLNALEATEYDLVIIDYSREGDESSRFTAGEIEALKDSPGGEKLVLAYMSVGEAEDYRWYWEESWDVDGDGYPDARAPSWLGHSNPEWPENYKVRYWEEEWKSIIFGSHSSYIDKVMEAGFDGVYLDIIDAYEYWGPGGERGLERKTAEQEMVDLVVEITEYARVTKGRESFGVFPQNGEALLEDPEYLKVITGIGKEDTWYDGDEAQPASYTKEVTQYLDMALEEGKLVLVTDYVLEGDHIDEFYLRAVEKGFVPYATVRDLDVITINTGYAPD